MMSGLCVQWHLQSSLFCNGRSNPCFLLERSRQWNLNSLPFPLQAVLANPEKALRPAFMSIPVWPTHPHCFARSSSPAQEAQMMAESTTILLPEAAMEWYSLCFLTSYRVQHSSAELNHLCSWSHAKTDRNPTLCLPQQWAISSPIHPHANTALVSILDSCVERGATDHLECCRHAFTS